MDIERADLVQSTAGRDRGMLFYVIGTEGAYLLLANGRQRKLENPKRKKLKHVRKVPRKDTRVTGKLLSGEKVLNSELRRDLADQSRSLMSQNQGGF